jgi:hypothetical protein
MMILRARRRGTAACLAWVALFVAGCGTGNAAAPTSRNVSTPAARVDLNRVILSGAQVGPGYRLRQRPDGHGVVGFVTLDMCGFTFRSENLRVDRLQVNYVRRGAPMVSNELVTYGPGGAEQALREVTNAVSHCPPGPVSSRIQGVQRVTYRIRRVSGRRLLPGSIALIIHLTASIHRRHIVATTVAVYQVKGNALSGVYTLGGGNVAAQQRVALHAAQESASNLIHT